MESSPPKESGKDKNIEIENQNEKNKAPQKVEIVKIKNQYSFKSTDRLGGGSFGQIYKGINLKTKEEVAIKIESKNIETPQLIHESKILKALNDNDGFPKVYLVTPLDDVLIMVMELLGENLQKYIIIYPKDSKSSLLLCSMPLCVYIEAYKAVPVKCFPSLYGI